jgi:hypothetical protein
LTDKEILQYITIVLAAGLFLSLLVAASASYSTTRNFSSSGEIISSGSATFGTATVGGSSVPLNIEMPKATQYTPDSSGTVTNIKLYLSVVGSGGYAQVAIYGDSGNAPGALLAKSSSDYISSSGWHDFSGFNVAVTGGTPYWLAAAASNGNLYWYYNEGGANYYRGSWSSSYGTFPSPYIKGSSGYYTTSLYAVYTPSVSPPPSSGSATFGTTSVGGLSTTLYTGIPRATQYTPASSGTVTNIKLYLTVVGSGGYAQVAIYSDSGNAPGTLLAKSSSDYISSGGWHDFSGFNVAVTGGTPYWLACEASNGNLYWYYSNGGALYYQSAGYGYGTFPSSYARGGSGYFTTSIYAVYTPY